MRDPKRIQSLLYDLGNVWEQCFPDMRFMQVICNFQAWLHTDGFYIEDDKILEEFCQFATDMMMKK